MSLTVTAWPSLSPDASGTITVYRRKCHLLIWNETMLCERPWWWLYWSDRWCQTFACVHEVNGTRPFMTMHDSQRYACPNEVTVARAFLPLCELLHHWDWFYGEVCGFQVLEGWSEHGRAPAKVLEITKMPDGFWHWELPPRWDPNART